MNENDRENLKFLMEASRATLTDWYYSVSIEDVQYASALLECNRLENIDNTITNNVGDAAEYLKKFTRSNTQ